MVCSNRKIPQVEWMAARGVNPYLSPLYLELCYLTHQRLDCSLPHSHMVLPSAMFVESPAMAATEPFFLLLGVFYLPIS